MFSRLPLASALSVIDCPEVGFCGKWETLIVAAVVPDLLGVPLDSHLPPAPAASVLQLLWQSVVLE